MELEDFMNGARNWILREAGCATIMDLENLKGKERYPSLIGLGSYGKSVTVEVVTDRERYLQDLEAGNWVVPEKEVGKFRFVCTSTDLINKEELPENWGLLYVGEDGQATCKYNPYSFKSSKIWRNGFDDNSSMDNLLREVISHDQALKNLQYRSVLH